MSSVEQWVRTQNANLEQGHFSSPTDPGMNPGCLSPMSQNMPPGMVGRNMMTAPGSAGHPDMQSPGAMDNANFPHMGGLGPPDGQGNLSQSKVPDDNLTPEQLQRRGERLANLRKLQAMLFPEQRGPGGPNGPPPPGMMGGPGGPGMPPNMMPGGGPPMSSGPGMHSPNSMISSMAGGPPMGPGGPPGPHMGPGAPFPGAPPNFENMTPAQREWFKLQQDYYNDKRRKQDMDRMRHLQQMQQMGMNIPPGEAPPHFFRMRGPGMPPGPMSPTSPNFTGPMGPNDPAFMMGPRRPGPPMNMPGGPNFDPMGPMGPGPMGFPFGKEDMMRPPMKGGNMPMIQRAGNPEQFSDMIPPISAPPGSGGTTKPPPPYGQSNKRKRSGDDMDELYKKLQPAPSPQQFSYLNQFEGQELTITKQLNMAYQEQQQQPEKSPAQQQPPPTSSQQVPQNSGPPNPHPPNSKSQNTSQPPTPSSSQPQPSPRPPVSLSTTSTSNACSSAPPSSSVSSPHATSRPSSRPSSVSGTVAATTSTMLPPSPLTMTTQTPGNTGSTSQVSSTNNSGGNNTSTSSQRLSHFDLPGSQLPGSGGSGSNSKTKPSKEHMNITSTNLVNLAKGVEHLSNQMQQNMMQGGPFHNIQIQGQISNEMESVHPVGGGGGGPTGPMSGPNGGMAGPNQQPGQPTNGPCSMDGQGQPSVNNTYVNATMSIGQLNIQSIHPGQGGNGNFSANMQTQQMNNDMMGPGPHNNIPGNPSGMMNSQMMQQDPMSKMPPCSQTGMPPGMQRPFPGHSPSLTSTGSDFPISKSSTSANAPVGNASVQIQAKAPNTIQYLPAHPPTSQGGGTVSAGQQVPRKGEIPADIGGSGIPPRFPSPLPNLDPLPSGGPSSRNKFLPPGGGMPNSPLDMMNHSMGGGMPPGSGAPPHLGGPGGPPHPGPPMGMQQSMMVPGGGSMQQQMGGMPYNSPSPMHPGPGGPSPVGPLGPDVMMQGQMQAQHMSMQGPMGMRGEPGVPMMGHPGAGGHSGMISGSAGGQGGGYTAQYHQFQQQLYAQGRPRGSGGGSGGMNPAGMGGMPHRMMGPDHMMMGGMGPGDMVPGGMGPGPIMGPGPAGMMGPGPPQGMGGPMGPGGMGNMIGPGMPNMP